jgi:hypothetical protein
MSEYPSGIKFPFSFSQAGGVTKVGGASKVSSNLKALVTCDIRDRLIYKEVGVISYKSVLRNFTNAFIVMFKKIASEAIYKYEPRATNVSIEVKRKEDADGYYVVAEVSYLFKNSGEFATLSLELKEV